jgi:hypothetical protein
MLLENATRYLFTLAAHKHHHVAAYQYIDKNMVNMRLYSLKTPSRAHFVDTEFGFTVLG